MKAPRARCTVESEHRHFPRIRDSARIKWRVAEDATPASPSIDDGLQINISGGGVCFLSQTQIDLGAMLAVELHLPNYPSGIIALARVVWVDEVDRDDERGFEIGAEFHWIGWDSNFAQQQIAGYVKSRLAGK
jgi:hypothetical protein